jgi:hypothetical protein
MYQARTYVIRADVGELILDAERAEVAATKWILEHPGTVTPRRGDIIYIIGSKHTFFADYDEVIAGEKDFTGDFEVVPYQFYYPEFPLDYWRGLMPSNIIPFFTRKDHHNYMFLVDDIKVVKLEDLDVDIYVAIVEMRELVLVYNKTEGEPEDFDKEEIAEDFNCDLVEVLFPDEPERTVNDEKSYPEFSHLQQVNYNLFRSLGKGKPIALAIVRDAEHNI